MLPRPLARGETHDFAMLVRLPAGAPMRPYFACVLKHPCALLDLRVRFDRARLPGQVRLLRNAFQRDVNDAVLPHEAVPIDLAGEIRLTFQELNPGMAYGARWDW